MTKWIAKSGTMQSRARNIKVIETFKIAPSKYLQIIKMGKKYFAIGVTKEQITFLTELDETQLDLDLQQGLKNGDGMIKDISFKEVMKNMLSNIKDRDDKK